MRSGLSLGSLKMMIFRGSYEPETGRYDRPHIFFYLDPPYYGMTVYRFNSEQGDFGRLGEVLGGLKGKFLMSLNDHKEVRRIFKGFRFQTVQTKYSTMNGRNKGRNTQRRELLIMNY